MEYSIKTVFGTQEKTSGSKCSVRIARRLQDRKYGKLQAHEADHSCERPKNLLLAM